MGTHILNIIKKKFDMKGIRKEGTRHLFVHKISFPSLRLLSFFIWFSINSAESFHAISRHDLSLPLLCSKFLLLLRSFSLALSLIPILFLLLPPLLFFKKTLLNIFYPILDSMKKRRREKIEMKVEGNVMSMVLDAVTVFCILM